MKEFLHKYQRQIIGIKIIGVITLLVIVCVLQKKQLSDLKEQNKVEFLQGGDIGKARTIDSLQNLVDSLHAENFPCQIELSRYERAYQIFMERNPKAAEQYGTIISDETE